MSCSPAQARRGFPAGAPRRVLCPHRNLEPMTPAIDAIVTRCERAPATGPQYDGSCEKEWTEAAWLCESSDIAMRDATSASVRTTSAPRRLPISSPTPAILSSSFSRTREASSSKRPTFLNLAPQYIQRGLQHDAQPLGYAQECGRMDLQVVPPCHWGRGEIWLSHCSDLRVRWPPRPIAAWWACGPRPAVWCAGRWTDAFTMEAVQGRWRSVSGCAL
jgi:hypothetical protein